MAYATQSDLEKRLAPELLVLLADDDGDGAADGDTIAAALDDAEAQIDQALAQRYVTPVAAPPAILKRWCLDLAVEALFLRKREAMAREHTDRVALAQRALEAIATGQVGLSGAEPCLENFETESTRRGEEPIFGDDALEEY